MPPQTRGTLRPSPGSGRRRPPDLDPWTPPQPARHGASPTPLPATTSWSQIPISACMTDLIAPNLHSPLRGCHRDLSKLQIRSCPSPAYNTSGAPCSLTYKFQASVAQCTERFLIQPLPVSRDHAEPCLTVPPPPPPFLLISRNSLFHALSLHTMFMPLECPNPHSSSS